MRLRQKNIQCFSSPKIPIAGNVNAIWFDKTGTLTKNSLNFLKLISV